MKITKLVIVLLFSASLLVACNDDKKKEEEKEKARMEQAEVERAAELEAEKEREEWVSNSIAAKAVETESLSTLVSALQNAELVEVFKENDGPYTVFAPTNAAFEKVPKANLDTLMKPENKEKLAEVLKYHVVEGKVASGDLVALIKENNGSYVITTLEGAELTASLNGENVILTDGNGNKATVTTADVEASNGVIHIIDGVVMKKS